MSADPALLVPPLPEDPPLVPARMVNELSYCPRLFALEWLHAEFEDNAFTVDGRRVHRRVDQPGRRGLPKPPTGDPDDGPEDEPLAGDDDEGGEGDDPAPTITRQVKLSDPALGLLAVIDLVEHEDGRVTPVDFKRGRAPDVPHGAYEPERVQVCVQALLLRAHGYRCDEGALYFAGSRRRVPVELSPELIARTLELRDQARALAGAPRGPLPPPLIDSPKCRGCSLVGICLPDEVNALSGRGISEARPLYPARVDGVPLVVRLQGGFIGKDGGEIVVRERGKPLLKARIADTSEVIVYGSATTSSALLAALAEADVPVALHSFGGWYQGSFTGGGGVGALLRIAQHDAAADPARALAIARELVRSKIKNQRTMLRRNGEGVPAGALAEMKRLAGLVDEAGDTAALMGVEGSAARIYFMHFDTLIRGDLRGRFQMDGRNRRPPQDPVNCLLSFAYACLVREVSQVLQRVGFDAWRGFLHQPRHGRPALALDLMEEFRPILADSAVLTAINTGAVGPDDFLVHPTGVALTEKGRKAFLMAWQRRLDELATHPVTGTRASMLRMLEVHARLFARFLHGELALPPSWTPR
jgi:CRISPR-associated endonuclease Cas1/CRISPR-associated protein Cas4